MQRPSEASTLWRGKQQRPPVGCLSLTGCYWAAPRWKWSASILQTSREGPNENKGFSSRDQQWINTLMEYKVVKYDFAISPPVSLISWATFILQAQSGSTKHGWQRQSSEGDALRKIRESTTVPPAPHEKWKVWLLACKRPCATKSPCPTHAGVTGGAKAIEVYGLAKK